MDFDTMSLADLFACADEIMDKPIYKDGTATEAGFEELDLADLFARADEIMSDPIYQ